MAHPYLHLRAQTAFQAWKAINEHFIYGDPSDSMVMAGRDFSNARYCTRLEIEGGFGLPETPPPLFNLEKRTATLEKRYIDPVLWQEGIDRLLIRRDRSTGTYPNSFLMQFHRRPTSERKVPAGGGCLVSINLTWFKKAWYMHVLMRASEITARLLSDMYFVQHACRRIASEGQLKRWDPENVHITWELLLPSQMKYMVPLYLLLLYGDDAVVDFMEDPAGQYNNQWQQVIKDHFWNEFIYPEKIKWAQRRKWSEKFLAWSNRLWGINALGPIIYRGLVVDFTNVKPEED